MFYTCIISYIQQTYKVCTIISIWKIRKLRLRLNNLSEVPDDQCQLSLCRTQTHEHPPRYHISHWSRTGTGFGACIRPESEWLPTNVSSAPQNVLWVWKVPQHSSAPGNTILYKQPSCICKHKLIFCFLSGFSLLFLLLDSTSPRNC